MSDIRPLEILLVEDNPGDVLLIKVSFREENIFRLSVVKNGLEALSFLKKQDKYENSEIPELILLDLDMPHMDGRQFLKAVKLIDKFSKIPIIVQSGSTEENVEDNVFKLGANGFLPKPVEILPFKEKIESLRRSGIVIRQV